MSNDSRYQAAYYEAHKPEIRARQNKHKRDNAEHISHVSRDYHLRNKAKRNKQARDYKARKKAESQ